MIAELKLDTIGIGADATGDDQVAPAAPDLLTAPASGIADSNPYRYLQWHLDGPLGGANPNGINAEAVWSEYTGAGVRIGLIDEGFDTRIPDLTGRFDLSLSYDPRDTGAINIRPDSVSHSHGTMVSSVVGAAADNNFGVVGVAYGATLAGFYMRYGSGGSSRDEVADLLARQVNVDISNNSWGYTTQFSDNFRVSSWEPLRDALETGVTEGRDGLGTVYVFSAGNDRQYFAGSGSYDGDNTNYHSLTNSRYVITAAASNRDGEIAHFSTPGASILVTAPGQSILTTRPDNNDNNYTNDFVYADGTSFSAPIVSGVVALMLEANPQLGYRDVEEILALSARQIDPSSSGWEANGATNWNGGGHMVSHDFGFGLVDAHAAVRLAEIWTTRHDADNEDVNTGAGSVPANDPIVANSYTVTVGDEYADFSIDWIEIDVSLLHTHVGDLRIALVSPTGTESVLVDRPSAGTNTRDNLTFTFSTNHSWGESAAGVWTLIVEDAGTSGTGTMTSYALRFYGDEENANDTYYYTDDFGSLGGNRTTLSDDAGEDTINAAAVTGNLSLDLTPGATSTIDGRSVVIAAGTLVEIAYGGDGNDTITGNTADNDLWGGRGNDALMGAAGQDVLMGEDGGDNLYGGDANDSLEGGRGNDALDGGSGVDTALFSGVRSAYAITAVSGGIQVSGADGVDTLTSIEFLAFDDGTIAAPVSASLASILWQHSDGTIAMGPRDIAHVPDNWVIAATGDFDGDRDTDIMWRHREGLVLTWEMENGNHQANRSIAFASLGWEIVDAGDFDADGDSDILWRHRDGAVVTWEMEDGAYVGNHNIAFASVGWRIQGMGDFDADGDSDVIWRHRDGAVVTWEMEDGAYVQNHNIAFASVGWSIQGTADVDGDGDDDILWRHNEGAVVAWEMEDGAYASNRNIGSAPTSWRIEGTGDFSGDGTDDILWRHNDGTVVTWEMNGGDIHRTQDFGQVSNDWQIRGTGAFDLA
jgi:subtilisin-like proprotein convertase family protein